MIGYRRVRINGSRWWVVVTMEVGMRCERRRRRQVLRQTAAAESQWPGRHRTELELELLITTGWSMAADGCCCWGGDGGGGGGKADAPRFCSTLFWCWDDLRSDPPPTSDHWRSSAGCCSTIIFGCGCITAGIVKVGVVTAGAEWGGGSETAALFFASGASLVP